MNSRIYSVEELQLLINREVEKRLSSVNNYSPASLYEPIIYSMSAGGKRVRPLLLLLANNMFSGSVTAVIPAALAIEVFHNFTLLHDDIIDNASVRRNLPTVHVKFNENSAILAGDAMAFLSYGYLMEAAATGDIEVLKTFTDTALDVCKGQQYDMDFEVREEIAEDEYLKMIRLKTAVLLGCSLKMGALLAGADRPMCDQLYELGINLGMGFQLQDDLLDTFGDQKRFGKRIGGDITANKKTFLLVKAMENGSEEQKSLLKRWFAEDSTDLISKTKKIESVTEIYLQTGADKITKDKIEYYFDNTVSLLKSLSVEKSRKEPLKLLIKSMISREF